jgi:hypothetical protein
MGFRSLDVERLGVVSFSEGVRGLQADQVN